MDYFYTYVNKTLEERVKKYIKENKNHEIFLGLIGKIKARMKEKSFFLYEIVDVIAFPNISKYPEYQAMVSESWYDILFENIQLSPDHTLTPLGVLHSHVMGKKDASDIDFQFMKKMSKKLNRLIMIICSFSSTGRFQEKAYVLVKNEDELILTCRHFQK